MNDTIDIRKGDELNEKHLINFLNQAFEIQIDKFALTQFPGGYSNLTYLVTFDEKEWVLRKPPKGANIKSGHDMAREYKIISALHHNFGKVPEPILYCEAEDVIGSPFYLMEKVPGWILRSSNNINAEISQAQMSLIFNGFTDTFVSLHNVDYQAVGLDDLGNPENYSERQIHGWTKRYYAAKTDEVDVIEKLAKWLADHLPHASGASLIHNDFKYDNLILNPDNNEVVAILDWEMSTLGEPLMDLGSSLGYWVNADDPDWLQAINLSPTTIPGNPSREGLLQAYASKSGLDPGNGVFYYAFGMLKLGVIAQQIYYRYKLGHTSDKRFANLDKVVRACGTMGLQSVLRKKVDTLF